MRFPLSPENEVSISIQPRNFFRQKEICLFVRSCWFRQEFREINFSNSWFWKEEPLRLEKLERRDFGCNNKEDILS